MEHVAIDLGGRESRICVRGADGTVVDERTLATERLGRYLEGRPRSRVVLETCAEAFAIADQALELKHEVRVVPGTLVRTLGVGARGVKNDRQDARILSEVSCRIDLPSVHVPSALSRRRKAICGMREALVASRTQLINSVRSWIRSQAGSSLRTGATQTFVARVRARFPSDELPRHVERTLRVLEVLTAQIAEADEDLARMAAKDDECRRLMTVPGVGPTTAIRFAAAVDEVGRFAGAEKIASYLGLTPGEDSSGSRQRYTGITKAGSPALRRTLVQAAWAARRQRGFHPMLLWCTEVEKRRGKRIAAVALARKMARILYALLRDGTTYSSASAAMTP